MDPEIVLNRGIEAPGKCLDEWLEAFAEIQLKHPELKATIKKRLLRIKCAFSMVMNYHQECVGIPDETTYAQYGDRYTGYYQATQKAMDALEGDFPCGHYDDMVLARRFFSIREIAYIQLGLADEIDPYDFKEMPRHKRFWSGMTVTETDDNNFLNGRKGFIHECLGNIEDAIDHYERITYFTLDFHLAELSKTLPFGTLVEHLETQEGVRTIGRTGHINRGRITGVVWYKEILKLPDGTMRTTLGCGKANPDGKNIWGVFWDGTELEPNVFGGEIRIDIEGANDSWLEVRTDCQNRLDSCYYFYDGCQFYYDDEGTAGKFAVLPVFGGDKPTHVIAHGRLIELDQIESREDALEVYRMFKAVIACDPTQEQKFGQKLNEVYAMAFGGV